MLVAPVARAGIWDPFELNVAELSRRVAIHVFSGANLAIEGGENGMPRLGDLGRGELPFDSMALGFRLFGLHDWAGRLPLALWGVAGVFALYWMLSRLLDRRAGLYGAIALMTMPLYFLHARTMLGDIVTMAACTIAFAGLAVAVFDRSEGSMRVRGAAVALGVFGLAAGFLCRGLLMGVAVPALGIGLAWGVTVGSAQRESDRFGDIVSGACLLLGVIAAGYGTYALFDKGIEMLPFAGSTIAPQPKFPTFDYVILYLGHSLLPWSAFVPFAVGRLFRAPPGAPTDPQAAAAAQRESHLRIVVLLGASVAFGCYSLVAPRVGYIPFAAPALLAAVVAIAVRDYERGAPASRALGVGVVVLLALYLRDYNMFPEKALSAFGVGATVPDSFKDTSSAYLLWTTGLFAFLIFFAWLESDGQPYFRADEYRAWLRTLLRLWNGNVVVGVIGAVALELLLIGLAVFTWLGVRQHWKAVAPLGIMGRVVVLNLVWAVPVLIVGIVWIPMAIRDAFRFLHAKTRISRGAGTVAAGLLVGGLFSFGYYPALAAQLSPKEVFEAYERVHRGSEPLGLLGLTGRSAAYHSGGEVKMFTDVQAAYTWLTAGPSRRWLAVRAEDLTRLNSTYRSHATGARQNIPVLDARSSQILLVSNELLPGEQSQSPYDSVVLGQEPSIQNKVSANLQDQLEVLGWEVRDSSGQLAPTARDANGAVAQSVVPAKKYHFRIFYKVLAAVSGDWETFIHIDGHHRRFNGDHKTLGGKYPFHLWQSGDFIVDDHEFTLEPNFTADKYSVYFGLYQGETRMKVKSGPHDDNRVEGGSILVH